MTGQRGVVDNRDLFRSHFLPLLFFIDRQALGNGVAFQTVAAGFVNHGAAGFGGHHHRHRTGRRFIGGKLTQSALRRGRYFFHKNFFSPTENFFGIAQSFNGGLQIVLFRGDDTDKKAFPRRTLTDQLSFGGRRQNLFASVSVRKSDLSNFIRDPPGFIVHAADHLSDLFQVIDFVIFSNGLFLPPLKGRKGIAAVHAFTGPLRHGHQRIKRKIAGIKIRRKITFHHTDAGAFVKAAVKAAYRFFLRRDGSGIALRQIKIGVIAAVLHCRV